MEIIYHKKNDKTITDCTGVGLGNFDGLHIGHMSLINTLIRVSKLGGLKSLVYTFTKHPENILRKKLFTPLLTTKNKKIELLGETSLDYLYFDEFDEKLSRMQPEDFVKKILVDKLKMKLAVAGLDYRFGYKGQGDIKYLKELGEKYDFKVVAIHQIKTNNEIASSSKIRNYIARGEMEKVFEMLGRHYSITAEVINGRRIGNTIGFPTANIEPEDYLILPKRGVYLTKTLLDDKLYSSITNIGFNPTFEEGKKISVETHIIDFKQEIYGKIIEVFFIAKIRDEKKFDSVNELKTQIKSDMKEAREYFNLDED
ncbi:MAG: bifunctional riboflavin kinase/FAD synthetase [Clostridia bacterium]|jgi:riboflavin kinase/FMN adenylyltransferase